MESFFAVLFVFLIFGSTCSAVENQEEFGLLCESGSPEEVAEAINSGANVNARAVNSWTALMHAALNNPNPDVLSVLIDAGADVNARDVNSWTALMHAAAGNHNPDVLSVLINAGADVNARNVDGWTALMHAAFGSPNPDILSVLINAGADLWVTNSSGKTAYDYMKGNEDLNKTDLFRKIQDLYWERKDKQQQ